MNKYFPLATVAGLAAAGLINAAPAQAASLVSEPFRFWTTPWGFQSEGTGTASFNTPVLSGNNVGVASSVSVGSRDCTTRFFVSSCQNTTSQNSSISFSRFFSLPAPAAGSKWQVDLLGALNQSGFNTKDRSDASVFAAITLAEATTDRTLLTLDFGLSRNPVTRELQPFAIGSDNANTQFNPTDFDRISNLSPGSYKVTGLLKTTTSVKGFTCIFCGAEGGEKARSAFDLSLGVKAEIVPEPSSALSLLALGTLGAGSALLRKQKQKSASSATSDV